MDVINGQLIISALATGFFYALIALGLNLIYGTMRLLNVAHGDLVMIGAYVGFFVFTLLGISPLIALVGAVMLTAVLGALGYTGLFRTILRRARSGGRAEANSLIIFFGISR